MERTLLGEWTITRTGFKKIGKEDWRCIHIFLKFSRLQGSKKLKREFLMREIRNKKVLGLYSNTTFAIFNPLPLVVLNSDRKYEDDFARD